MDAQLLFWSNAAACLTIESYNSTLNNSFAIESIINLRCVINILFVYIERHNKKKGKHDQLICINLVERKNVESKKCRKKKKIKSTINATSVQAIHESVKYMDAAVDYACSVGERMN
jgi:hypothetical protein